MSIFNRPLSQIELADIDKLIQAATPEGINLDYKGDLDGSDRDKKEIAKDVSAMANSQGGYIIYGVPESDQIPQPVTGIPRLISSQPVEEWIAQVIAGNIAQRPAFELSRAIECSHDVNKIVLILYVPPSIAAPHMITVDNDNRYYRRYYKRHEYQSLPAEEYEVRDMFMRSLRYLDVVERTFGEHHLQDIEDSCFGLCRFAQRFDFDEDGSYRRRLVKILAVPRLLQEGSINTAGGEFIDWISPHRHNYPPETDFMPEYQREPTLDGYWLFDGEWNALYQYMHIYRNGVVEFVFPILSNMENTTKIVSGQIAGYLTSFLGFLANLADFSNYYADYEVALAVRETTNTTLHTEDAKLAILAHTKVCKYPNILVRHTVGATELREAADLIVREIMIRFCNAYGYAYSLAHDQDGSLV